MRAELHLARRYLVGLRRRTHVATVTAISLVGLGLGVMALVVTLALLEGFQSSIRSELVARTAHARIEPVSGRTLPEAFELASELQRTLGDVEQVLEVRGAAMATSAMDAVPASLLGRSDAVGLILDEVLAARLDVGVGDEVDLVSPRQRLTPMGPLPIRVRAEVVEVRPPMPGGSVGQAIVPLETGQVLLWGDDVVEAIELRDPADPWGLGGRARRALAGSNRGVRVDGLDALQRPLLLALALERVMIFVAVGLMLVIAALNLLCNVAMVAAEKRRDLAVLAGLGMTPTALRRLFLVLGVGIGLAGATGGAAVGTALAMVLDATRALSLPRGVFVVSAVPFRVEPAAVALVIAVALSLATAASWLPARVVARREPADGLRDE